MRIQCLNIIMLVLFLGACSTNQIKDAENTSNQTITSSPTYHHPEYNTRQHGDKSNNAPVLTKQDDIEVNDVWKRIQQNLVIKRNLNHSIVKSKLAFYAGKQEFLDRVAERATPYLYYIVEELEKRNMPLDLALLPIVESAYQPFARSPQHASGIWQFIPSTGRHYGLKQNWWYDGRRDIVAATDAALNYLQKLNQDFEGDWLLTLAAYNAGEGNVSRAVEQSHRHGRTGDFWSLKLKNETLGYVPSLLAIAEIVANPSRYNVKLTSIPNEPYFEIVDTEGQIDLSTVSQLTGMNMDEIYTLNPGINNWATDPDGPHHLLIPVDKADAFRTKLAALPEGERVKWQKYEIRSGDTLGRIAYLYRCDVNTLRQINHLRGNLIRVGHTLLIPTSKKPLSEYSLSQDVRSFGNLKRSPDGQRLSYKIKSGDTLWDLSLSYGVSIEQLCAWNGLNKKSILRPGQTLTVYSNEKPEFVQTVAHTVSTEKQGHITYTVKQGDSLWLIARHHGVTVEQLQKWNSLNKHTSLQPGQQLDIYTGQPPADV